MKKLVIMTKEKMERYIFKGEFKIQYTLLWNSNIFILELLIQYIINSQICYSEIDFCKKGCSPLVALSLACICGAATGIANAIAKMLENVGPFTISSVRFAVIFLISFSLVIYR